MRIVILINCINYFVIADINIYVLQSGTVVAEAVGRQIHSSGCNITAAVKQMLRIRIHLVAAIRLEHVVGLMLQ